MGVYRGIYSSTETARHLDVNRLIAKIKEAIKKAAKEKGINPSPEEIATAIALKASSSPIEGEFFAFDRIPNKFGGYRWYAKCPKCGKNVLKLYKPDKAEHFFCRTCHNLRAPSALYGPTKQYKEVVRPMLKLDKIKETLATKRLSAKQEQKLLDEYDEIKKELEKSSLFRKEKILAERRPGA